MSVISAMSIITAVHKQRRLERKEPHVVPSCLPRAEPARGPKPGDKDPSSWKENKAI